MKDTDTATELAYRRTISGLSPGRRLLMSTDMYDAATKLVYAGIRSSAGRALTSAELRKEFFLRMYGRDFSTLVSEEILRRLTAARTGSRSVD